MLCLSLDTTGLWCSAALLDGDKVLAASTQEIERSPTTPGHGEVLAPMVQTLLRQTKKAPAKIDKIIVCTGPGSFTGVRVGLSFAKGFALPHGHKIIGISALEVWAGGQDVMAAADVRRGEVFWQMFKNGAPQGTPQLTDTPTAKAASKDMDIVGSGAHLICENTPAQSVAGFICPEKLARLGASFSAKARPAQPLYHRPPDAKLPGGKMLKT